MLLINQDRDKAVIFNPSKDSVRTVIMFADKKYMGVNLVFRNVLLGTFYNIKEAMTERNSIMNYQHEIYVVSGYSAWDEWETVSQLMKG